MFECIFLVKGYNLIRFAAKLMKFYIQARGRVKNKGRFFPMEETAFKFCSR